MNAIAKRDRETNETRSLIGHSLDVALAASRLVSAPVLRARLETAAGHALTDAQLARLTVLAGLHDCGKAVNGFQQRITGQSRGTSHLAEALAALMAEPRVQQALQVPMLATWFTDVSAAFACSICHHGSPVDQASISTALAQVPWQVAVESQHDPIAAMTALMDEMVARFPLAASPATPIQWTHSLDHLMAGIFMLADWLGSSLPIIGPDWRPDAVNALLDDLPWSGWHSGAPADSILPGAPIGAQQAMCAIPVTERLVIIEAPTGTGKTEAALMRALALVEVGAVDGMYFALPTRAAATEIHDRIAALARTHSPALAGRIVRAVSGQLDTDPWQQSASWAIGSPKRVMSAPIAVGTVDQAMLSSLRTRHAWMRGAALSRHLLVIDEVHASDAYMLEIVRTLVKRQLDVGGHALLMSATLGEVLRAELEGRRRLPLPEAVAAPYPRVGQHQVSAPSVASSISVQPREAALRQICDTVSAQGCALIIRSTVDTARETHAQLVAAGVPAMLHHSRYADLDRQHLDAEILRIIGKGGSRQQMAIVATQTAEQSLDIDADLLVSDPAPADVLLQRRGRLGRHRPEAVLLMIVIDPGDGQSAADAALRLVQGRRARVPAGSEWAYVYDVIATMATVDALRDMARISVPSDVRRLVETATHPDSLLAYADARGWDRLWQETWGARLAMRQTALGGVLDWRRPYMDQPVDNHVPTRLGEGTVTVRLSPPIRSPFTGAEIDAMPVPWRWIRDEPPESVGATARSNGDWQIDIGNVQLHYGPMGLVKLP